ncbi:MULTISPECIES: hypothetical protein [unclassified Microbacterium]|uniref:hypothetical protein n=1 Tax=unclassified Microbacterium TaxID=2609290 RepID=UPI003C2F6294
MGRFIPLTGVNPPSTRPKVNTLHPLLPENGGALLLVEPGAPGGLGFPTAGVVPPSNNYVKNIALAQALAAIPGSDELKVSPQLYYGSFLADGATRGKIERTAKGGLHTLIRPADESVTTGLAELHSELRFTGAAGGLVAFLEARKATDSFFWTTWFIDTYIPSGASTSYDDMMYAISNTAASGNFLVRLRPNSNENADLGSKLPVNQVNVATYGSAGTNDQTGTSPIQNVHAMLTGPYGSLNSYNGGGATYGKHRSRAYYLAYIEDLTISGRTYAQVEAINAAAHAAAFGPGGRYAGDTWTNPATWTP